MLHLIVFKDSIHKNQIWVRLNDMAVFDCKSVLPVNRYSKLGSATPEAGRDFAIILYNLYIDNNA